MSAIHSILECCVMFSGVKLSIRSFNLLLFHEFQTIKYFFHLMWFSNRSPSVNFCRNLWVRSPFILRDSKMGVPGHRDTGTQEHRDTATQGHEMSFPKNARATLFPEAGIGYLRPLISS